MQDIRNQGIRKSNLIACYPDVHNLMTCWPDDLIGNSCSFVVKNFNSL
ncbi:MAG: hypothetical protein JW806_07235 [Sedimentisphaerales bacterium]|nr:hypothetical protein [Sedimentisphaerales bacterium]